MLKIYVGYDLEHWSFPIGIIKVFNKWLKINVLCFHIIFERCENG
jgi:hypothetical protein